MLNIPTTLLSIIALLISTLWFHKFHFIINDTGTKFKQVNTTCTSILLQDRLTAHKDTLFEDRFDPRRYPLEILNQLSTGNADTLSFDWGKVVDLRNKTELGVYYMALYQVKEICLMNGDKIFHYPVVTDSSFNSEEGAYTSINTTINNWFDRQNKSTYEIAPYKSVPLSTFDFQLNFTQRIKSLPSPQQHSAEYRYFKEASLLSANSSNGLSHYDLRFFYSKIPAIDRISTLHRIARSWARFTNSHHITTWLAHGSLLGYFFNGLILPWDDDLDVQVSAEGFWELVRWNQTVVVDYQDYSNSGYIGAYLIDVNPFFYKRERNPDNKIDARFIDLRTGLYIDITVLTNEINDLETLSGLDSGRSVELYKLFDSQFEQIQTQTQPQYQSDILHRINSTAERQSLLSCKDYHFYTAEELSPLIPTVFEGEILYVPNNIESLLLREYGRKSLYLMDFNRFEFDKMENIWKSSTVPFEINSGLLGFAAFHYQTLKLSTHFKRHVWDSEELVKFETFRLDSWVRDNLCQWY
ncbi:hypothetical protein WICPIJ_000928 [Wickerhamomyces pijperi]|uniref:LicD/FKTN/FKRP nucleotidyltransferase domain-containing protein n=1 Tax=Wickerhamomyces pijperi TaxID=599730 RepID=A0A9P8TRX1_WICPI|nr:hypothetical protein WICPIJ_000928 [Wickerhamomyces pijperi]